MKDRDGYQITYIDITPGACLACSCRTLSRPSHAFNKLLLDRLRTLTDTHPADEL